MLHMAGVRSGAWHRRALLRARGYVFVAFNGCFGDMLWTHASIAEHARKALNAPSRDPAEDEGGCCAPGDPDYENVKGATIDNGCCGYVGRMQECLRKSAASAQASAAVTGKA